MKITAFWDTGQCSLVGVQLRTAAIIRAVMEAVRASETSVYSNETTRRYIPEGFNLQHITMFVNFKPL
jgi:hypothetical protein